MLYIYTMPTKNRNNTTPPPTQYRDAVIESNLRLSDRCSELEKALQKIESEKNADACEHEHNIAILQDEKERLIRHATMRAAEMVRLQAKVVAMEADINVYDKNTINAVIVGQTQAEPPSDAEHAVSMSVKKNVKKRVVKKAMGSQEVEVKSLGAECGKCDKTGWESMKNTELIEECTRLGIKGVKKLPKKGIVERLLAHYNGGGGDGKGNVVGL